MLEFMSWCSCISTDVVTEEEYEDKKNESGKIVITNDRNVKTQQNPRAERALAPHGKEGDYGGTSVLQL